MSKTMVSLKCLNNFGKTFEMLETILTLLINCGINLILTWSENCVISSNTTANKATMFAITDAKLYIPVVTVSTNGNAKLLQHWNRVLK